MESLNLDGTTVLADAAVLEALHWDAATFSPELLLAMGISLLAEFPPSASLNETNWSSASDKLVILTCARLPPYESALEHILSSGFFTELRVYSALRAEQHFSRNDTSVDSSERASYFAKLAASCRSWMKRGIRNAMNESDDTKRPMALKNTSPMPKPSASVEYMHSLMPLIPILQDVILLPSIVHIRPTFDIDEDNSILQLHAEETAVALAALLKKQGWDAELYSLGTHSQELAEQIKLEFNTDDSFSSDESNQTAAVFLIDRTLDLAPVVSHSDTLLDRCLSLCTRKGLYNIAVVAPEDLEIDAWLNRNVDLEDNIFIEMRSLSSENTMDDILVMQKAKDGLAQLRKVLIDKVTAEKLPLKLPKIMGKVTPSQLAKILTALWENESIRFQYLDLLQQALIITKVLQQSTAALWDELTGVEKVLLLAGSGGDGDGAVNMRAILGQLRELISPERSMFRVRDVLALSMLAYSLFGPEVDWNDVEDDEMVFKDALFRAILRDQQKQNADDSEDRQAANHQIESEVEKICSRLRNIAKARNDMQSFKFLHKSDSSAVTVSMIKRVLLEIYSGTADSLPEDIIHSGSTSKSGQSASRVLSGISRFLIGQNAKIRNPKDLSAALIFVHGGLTATEIKDIREVLQPAGIKFIIASNRLITQSDLVDCLIE